MIVRKILPGTGRWQPAGLTEGAQPKDILVRPSPSTVFDGPPPRAGENFIARHPVERIIQSTLLKCVGAVAILFATPLAAQTLTPQIAAPSADRIEAATELLAIIIPPAQRETMIATMLEPMMENIEQGMMQAPQFRNAFQNPEAQALFAQFMTRQRARTVETMQASLPGLFDAMARAYARRFTERQMEEIGEFYRSRTGQAYLREANTIMADPDVAAWQRDAMMHSMGAVQADMEAFAAEIAALEGGEGASAPQAQQPATNRLLDAMRGGSVVEKTEGEE